MEKQKPVKYTHCHSLLWKAFNVCCHSADCAHTYVVDWVYPLCGKLHGYSPITALAYSKVSWQKIQFPVTCTVLFLRLATVPPIKMFPQKRCIAYLCKAFYNWYLYVHTYVMGSQAVLCSPLMLGCISFNHYQAIRLISVSVSYTLILFLPLCFNISVSTLNRY